MFSERPQAVAVRLIGSYSRFDKIPSSGIHFNFGKRALKSRTRLDEDGHMLNTSLANRVFQLWEYSVSHGSLLIRSPRGSDFSTNLDIICCGVEYIAAPRFLRNLNIVDPTGEELSCLEVKLGKNIAPSSVLILSSSGNRFAVVAASFKFEENQCDIFDSPFEI